MFDINTLLLGTAISGLCLSVTTLSFWMASRGSSFMVTWSAAIVVIVFHIFAFWLYSQHRSPVFGTLACALLPVGAIGLYAAARQYADDNRPLRVALTFSLPYLLTVPLVFALGYDGAALVLQNAVVAAFIAAAGYTYLGRIADSRFLIGSLSVLHVVLSVSFALCGAVLLVGGQWRLGYAPTNWAEDINVVVSIFSMTGIGALTLSIDQARMARRHHDEAMTDPMTGLLNRRALLSRHAAPFGPRKAIILFDLDHFKKVNDRHGHAAGDAVLRRFSDVAREHCRTEGDVIRLGGEEFAVVMDDVLPEVTRRVGEGIIAAFAAQPIDIGDAILVRCTVSAGIAFGDTALPDLHNVLSRADRALYAAKRNGRNRVEFGEWRLVG